jgi:hypothetical protein
MDRSKKALQSYKEADFLEEAKTQPHRIQVSQRYSNIDQDGSFEQMALPGRIKSASSVQV